MHSARGHALWATATRLSSLPRSLAKPAGVLPLGADRTIAAAASRGPPRPRVLGPLGRPGPLSARGPAEAAARTGRPLQPAIGPPEAPAARIPALAGPDSPSPPSLGTWLPARAAPPGTGERGRGKAGPAAWSGGRAAPRLRTMPKPQAAGEEPGPPLQPTHPAWVSVLAGLGAVLALTDPGRLSGPGERRGAAALPARCAARPGLRGEEAGQGPREPRRDPLAAPRIGAGLAGRSGGLRKRAPRLLQEEWGRRGMGLCWATSPGKVSNLRR